MARPAQDWMGCCSSSSGKRFGSEDHKRQIINHFLPPGEQHAARFTYRLERVEERDMAKLRRNQQGNTNRDQDAGRISEVGASEFLATIVEGVPAPSKEEGAPEKKRPLFQAISSLLKNRLGTCDVPLVGQDRYMLVETPSGTSSNSFVTEEVVVEEDSLVRMVEERAAKGLLFASSTLSLATFEQMQAGDCLVLQEPLALDAGVDFESVLENVRERAMEGWRFRGGLQGRLQVQDYVLGYAAYPGVVVTPFSHVVLAKDKNAHRLQVEMVELRACGSVISGTLVRIVQAWAKRGWKLTGVLYNVVTTYDRVALDEPDTMHGAIQSTSVQGEIVGGDGQLHVCFDVGAFFERRLMPTQEGRMQAHIALQRRNCDVAQENANLQFDQDGNSLHLKRVV